MNAEKHMANKFGRTGWVTAAVQALPAYRGPKTLADIADGPRRVRPLHLNESPFPPSPRAIDAIHAHARDLNRYPDIHAHALAKALEVRTGVAKGQIVFGCGSDELIHFLCEISLSEGDTCVVPAPSFPRYALSTRLRGAMPLRVGLDSGGASDARATLAAIGPHTRLVFVCTPNPPSGGMMSADAIATVASGVPADVLLVVDEAYHEFGRHAGGPDILAVMARRRGPWAVLRTFSKAYGLGALRVGYALCGSPDVADALRKAKLQYNVTSLGQVAALAALEDDAYLRQTLDAIAAERTRLGAGLRAMQLKTFPSAANFVSAVMPVPAERIVAELERRGILVRDWRDPEHLREIRVTVGRPDDIDAVLDALREILSERAE